MATTKASSSVQLSLFPCQGTGVNDAQNANTIGKLSTYLKTRGGLWRLLALFPGSMPVEEALRLAPSVLTRQEPGRLAKADCLIGGVWYKKGSFIPIRKEVAV